MRARQSEGSPGNDPHPGPGEPGPGRFVASAAWIVVAASATGLFATYWDDSWHTVLGRDSAWIPPHLMLYTSIAAVGAVLATWTLTVLWRTRSVRAILETPGLALAVAAGTATAAAAPADAAWHASFGRDSVLWSPPHLLSVVGTAVLLVAALLAVGQAGGRVLRVGLGAALLGAAQIVLLEFETDVPQFSETLYVPLVVLTGLGSAWVIRNLVGGSFAVCWALAAYVALRLAVLAVLAGAGWLAPDPPLALLGLVIVDIPSRWGAARWPLAGLAVTGLQLLASALGISSVRPESATVAAIIVAPVLAAAAIVLLLRRKALPVTVAVALLVSLPLLAAPPARAHDPGQGPEIGSADFTVYGDGSGALSVFVIDIRGASVAGLRPIKLVARRAGQTVTANLGSTSSSNARPAYTGLITLPTPGLWFVYAELRDGSRQLETWRAVEYDATGPTVERRSIYLPAGAGPRPMVEFFAGALLYAVGALLVIWALLAVRRFGKAPGNGFAVSAPAGRRD